LIAIDLDGTLLDSHKKLPAGCAAVFKEAWRAGVYISIITGRNLCSVHTIGKELHLSGPHASSGGALVCGNGGRPVYARHFLKKEDIRKIVGICRRWNLTIFLENANRILVENNSGRYLEVRQPHYHCIPQLCDDILLKLNFQPLKATIIGEHLDLIRAQADFDNCQNCFHTTTTGEQNIEITSSGVNKGSALREISAVTGIPLQNIMAIGDSPNDLSMLQEAGVSAAVANAQPEVQQVAQMIVPSNDQSGVLWAIKNLVLPSVFLK
jgi:Cof subfamily protein (haloacid dehalogenase superfamily)